MTDNPQPGRYRTPEVEAVQWAGDNADQMRAFCSPFDFQEIEPEDRVEDPDQTAAMRESAHGTWRGLAPGDWAVRRGNDFYEVSAADFARQYEPAVPSAPADRAAILREAIDVAREEGHRLEEVAGIEPARGARCVAYLLRKLLAKTQPTELRRMADEAQQPEGAVPEEAVDLTDGPVRCPLCPNTVTLHTPSGARAHFTTVHPEQRVTGRGPGPWPLLVTDGAEAQQQPETQTELASLAVNAANALRDEKRHYEIACQEIARLSVVVARLRQMTDHWEKQLPEVIRTPAVVSAIRAVLEPAAVSQPAEEA